MVPYGYAQRMVPIYNPASYVNVIFKAHGSSWEINDSDRLSISDQNEPGRSLIRNFVPFSIDRIRFKRKMIKQKWFHYLQKVNIRGNGFPKVP